MTVEIPISANPAPAQAALRQVMEEFRKLRREAEAFNKIDLSGATEDLRRDLEAVQRNFRDLSNPRLGGLGRRIRETEQQDRAPDELDWERLYPQDSPEQRARRQRRFAEQLLSGTRQAPLPASPGENGPPAPDRPRPTPPEGQNSLYHLSIVFII